MLRPRLPMRARPARRATPRRSPEYDSARNYRRRRRVTKARPKSDASAPAANPSRAVVTLHPKHPRAEGAGGVALTVPLPEGIGAGGGAVAGACPPVRPISGTSDRTSAASWIVPRGANAVFVAAIGFDCSPPGGPPHTPRTGLSHAMGPVQG